MEPGEKFRIRQLQHRANERTDRCRKLFGIDNQETAIVILNQEIGKLARALMKERLTKDPDYINKMREEQRKRCATAISVLNRFYLDHLHY